MDIRELRIGNWIKIGNTETQVEGISTWDDVVQSSNFAEREVSEFQPIPITEERLLKFGFYKGDTASVFLDINDKTFLEGGKGILKYGVMCVCRENYFANNIEYVHQLQNLYFALTGEELTLGNIKH